jgi:hypothetical protein
MSPKTLLLIALVTIAVATVMIAGCTGPSQSGSQLSGGDIFDPQRFSMAVYNVTMDDGVNVTWQDLLVITHAGEPEGDRLTSVSFQKKGSTRADSMISADGRKTVSVLITSINDTDVQINGGQLAFNMTVLDDAWNSLDDVYGLTGTANVTTPAGQFDGCNVYDARKTLYFGNVPSDILISYYMHPSSPVPVMYTVQGPSGKYTYTLQSVYLPGDRDSTPERVIQAFFDDLDNDRPDSAFDYLVTYDAVNGKFVSPDDATYRQYIENMNRTYGLGDESFRVQYVHTGALMPGVTQAGYNTPVVPWTSVHYQVGILYAYHLEGSFYMVDLDGHWRIIV